MTAAAGSIKMHGLLQGVLAVVTGAASGIGTATVNALEAQGALVASVDLLEPDDPRWPDPTAIRFRADVSDEQDVELLVAAVARHGNAAILVNCAGIGSTTDTVNTTVETWDRVFAVNARGSFLTCRGFLPGMIESRQGSIVNVASVAGLVGLRDRAAYCASKGAVIALTRAIAVDHVSAGVRANVVCPGTVDSPWVHRLTAEVGVSMETLRDRQPLGRLGLPSEIAATIAFLAGPMSSFTTGAVVSVDGGLTAQ